MSAPLPILSNVGRLGPASRTDRRVAEQYSRELARIRSGGELAAAHETAKIEAIATVTEAALLATSHISAVEALLVQRTPHAEARLKHIADAGCTGMASVVLRMGSRL